MKIKCIYNNYEEECLTVGKIYTVLKKGRDYRIKDDNGIPNNFTKSRFIIINPQYQVI